MAVLQDYRKGRIPLFFCNMCMREQNRGIGGLGAIYRLKLFPVCVFVCVGRVFRPVPAILHPALSSLCWLSERLSVVWLWMRGSLFAPILQPFSLHVLSLHWHKEDISNRHICCSVSIFSQNIRISTRVYLTRKGKRDWKGSHPILRPHWFFRFFAPDSR